MNYIAESRMRLTFKSCASFLIALTFSLMSFVTFSQNNLLVIHGAYVILSGGTSSTNTQMVINQPSTLGIVRVSGGHIHSENQYNVVKWEAGSGTGNYVFPFGVGGTATDYIPFTFNKTTTASTPVSISTWATDQQNMPHPGISNVPAVSNMIGVPDSVKNAVDRFWDIQVPTAVTADLTFSYRSSENTTLVPGDTLKAEHWNGTSWDNLAGPGNPGVIAGIGTVGPIVGQTTFSPWTLTRMGLQLIGSTTQSLICSNQCTGTVSTTFAGGTAPYTYSWNTVPAQTTPIATGLCPGNYIVTVTDGANSVAIHTVAILGPSALTLNPPSASNNCYGSTNGSATVTASGGIAPYTYSWSTVPTQTTQTATGLTSGIYTVDVTDGNNCATITETVAVTESPTIIVNTLSINPSCQNENTGSVSISVSGGTPSYTISWSNGILNTGSTSSLSNLGQGNYIVTITDNSNCIYNYGIAIDLLNCPELFIPQIFSPNGDGKNDKFEIIKIESYPNNTLSIFNRWGSLIYTKKGYNNEWKGNSNVADATGTGLLPVGTYYVVLDFGDGSSKPYTGFVELNY